MGSAPMLPPAGGKGGRGEPGKPLLLSDVASFDSEICYHSTVKSKHRKVLAAVLAQPTLASVRFADIEAMLVSLGGELDEGAGSRIVITLGGARIHLHRPHPGKEAKRYQVEEVRAFLERLEIKP